MLPCDIFNTQQIHPTCTFAVNFNYYDEEQMVKLTLLKRQSDEV